MICGSIQMAVSERMDGQHLPGEMVERLDDHLASCPSCREFRDGAERVRRAIRIRPVEDIPDLTGPIMAALERQTTRPGPIGRRHRAARPVSRKRLVPVAAALVVGLVAGSLIVGGPWQRSPGPIAMASVVRGAQGAAVHLEAYRAMFSITEHGLSPQVTERHLSMDVAFRAPERFRVDVHDRTIYPSSAWTPTDLTYIADGRATYRSGPTGCPSDLPRSVCPTTCETVSRTSPFSIDAPLPADLVIPLTTLSSANGVEVLGAGTVLGRRAVEVEMSFERAAPLFTFLGLGGLWRPFYPTDRVVLWLDRSDWFPLRYTVYPSRSRERRAWELRFGLPTEPPDRPIFDVRAISVDERAPAAHLFAIPGGTPKIPLSEMPGRVGYVPITPTRPQGLRLSSAVAPPATEPTEPSSLLSYTRGLSYLLVGERRGPAAATPAVDPAAQQVTLANGGVAYYQPATDEHGRALAIRSAGASIYLETNLARPRLLAAASSLPIHGEPTPSVIRRAPGLAIERVSPATARARASFPVAFPSALPEGYELVSGEILSGRGTTGVSFLIRQRAADIAGDPIRLHEEPATGLPPASAARQGSIRVGGVTGRWTPSRRRLEWEVSGVYISLDGTDLGLTEALTIARSMRPTVSSSP